MDPSSAPGYAPGQHDIRPWGEWLVIDSGPGFVVKRITVRPGHRLSLQRHRHREEQWIFVAGVAEVTCRSEILRVEAGATAHIALGETHRVANAGTTDVVFIEVQLGALLSEDDIERLEDAYGRMS
ncbi:MAG TPA: phosphomannose isomerase type II C-terminal cupin domain [Acetobacteraceae bacterium]|nr:phosphomannose isomerase type II C-terminal cupin domain [Acetobacteraceae bacterium]